MSDKTEHRAWVFVGVLLTTAVVLETISIIVGLAHESA